MRFYGINGRGFIVTDNYTQAEIDNGIHLDNLRMDLRASNLKFIDVYDENMVFIRRLGR